MDSQILETVLRSELRKAGERWKKTYKEMSDKERLRILGCFAARRLISEEVNRQCGKNVEPETQVRQMDPELIGTQSPLGSGSGGGKRVIRGIASMS